MNLTSLTEHELLVFWVQMVVLLVTARGLGSLAKRVGQPAVVGELAAGLVLGPSLLGRFWGAGFDWLIPADEIQGAMLLTVGWIGVVFLVFATGYETDLALIATRGRAAVFVSTGSLLLPIVLGLVVGFAMPDVFLGQDAERVVFALFMAAALSISSLPVIAKIMTEMGLMRRNFGQLTLAAGMANDVVGWLLLGVIAGLASAGTLSITPVLVASLGMAAFVAIAFTLGQRLVDGLLKMALQYRSDLAARVAIVVSVTLFFGAITQWLGVEAVIGAFVAGILFGRSKYKHEESVEAVEGMTAAFFAPIFFATAGLRVDLGLLRRADVLFWAVIVLLVASVAKFVGSWLGARLARLPNREGLALGAGLNARGALEIVIATVGLSLGVLEQRSYTVIVLMAVATSMLAPPMLRWIVHSWSGTEEEQERIRKEKALSRNVIVRDRRILLPSQGGPNSLVAAQIADMAWPPSASATILSMGPEEIQLDLDPVLSVLDGRELTLHHVEGGDPASVIAAEAELNYGAVVMGAVDGRGRDRLVASAVDELLQKSPVPVVMARRSRRVDRPTPPAFARALVPVTGSKASRAAQEIAFNISERIGTEVTLLHVVNKPSESQRLRGLGLFRRGGDELGPEADPARESIASALLQEAKALADESGARAREVVRSGVSTADEVVAAANEQDIDLIVVGATLRRAAGHVFLGDLVHEVLDRCEPTVVVVALPEPALAAVEAESQRAEPPMVTE